MSVGFWDINVVNFKNFFVLFVKYVDPLFMRLKLRT